MDKKKYEEKCREIVKILMPSLSVLPLSPHACNIINSSRHSGWMLYEIFKAYDSVAENIERMSILAEEWTEEELEDQLELIF